jgi:ribonuclease HI
VGGVILGSGSEIKTTYAWKLGQAKNNQAEAYALVKGLELFKLRGISSLVVIEDSCIILSIL